MSNLCRSGTAKWIVCQAAIEGKTIEVVKADLERLRKGAGNRLLEYKSDLRTEDGLDIRIKGQRLVYRVISSGRGLASEKQDTPPDFGRPRLLDVQARTGFFDPRSAMDAAAA